MTKVIYPFPAYKFMLDLMACKGYDYPFSYDRSTLYRWRVSGYVPRETYLALLFYTLYTVRTYSLPVCLYDAFVQLGYDVVDNDYIQILASS